MFTMRVVTSAKAGSGTRGKKGMKPGDTYQLLSCRTSSSSDERKWRMQGKRAPGLPSSSLQPCTSIERTISLRQTRCADMQDPSNPSASRLAETPITRIGLERMPVVRDLVADGSRHDR